MEKLNDAEIVYIVFICLSILYLAYSLYIKNLRGFTTGLVVGLIAGVIALMVLDEANDELDRENKLFISFISLLVGALFAYLAEPGK